VEILRIGREVGHEMTGEGRYRLIIGKDGVDGYGFYKIEDCICTMVRLQSWVKGGGKAMVAKMKEMLPPDTLVEIDCVIEVETIEKLIKLGYFDQVIETENPLDVLETDFHDLKIVRVLEGGGLTVERVVVQVRSGMSDDRLSYFDLDVVIKARC
jgi:hypothetical protein